MIPAVKDSIFAPGTVVQLRSGGPLLTVVSTTGQGDTLVAYHNVTSGLFEKFSVNQRCLRGGIGTPEAPEDADRMRSTSVTKSSMS